MVMGIFFKGRMPCLFFLGVRGINDAVELKEMVLANGRTLGSRRTLSGITLVKVW
jgi:hypothetical protein